MELDGIGWHVKLKNLRGEEIERDFGNKEMAKAWIKKKVNEEHNYGRYCQEFRPIPMQPKK